MVAQAITDFKAAEGCKVLRIDLHSPGGLVTEGLELVRLIEKARESGQIVEIHGGGMVSSMATWIIAAGSPGHRYVFLHSLVVIHGLQSSGPFGERSCFTPPDPVVDEQDKIAVQMLETLAVLYAKYTGRPLEETRKWLKCGNEQHGNGWLLIKLGMADLIE